MMMNADANRGSIDLRQEGFTLNGRDVIYGSEKYIHLHTQREDGKILDVLWPSRVSASKVDSLAQSLVDLVKE